MSADHGDAFPDEHEEHENHERYLITYADMITLLMALFIILFAIGQTDLEKYRRFAEGAAGGEGILEGTSQVVGAARIEQREEVSPAEGVASALRGTLAETIDGAAVTVDDGTVTVRLPSDGLRFASGSAVLPARGQDVVTALAEDLRAAGGEIVVEGHTDDRPTGSARTNWELSTDRAAAVVRGLVEHGVEPHRLTAAGRADTEPIASNGDEAGRAANRRVEIVLLDPHAEGEPIQR